VGVRYHRVIFMMVTCASYHALMMLWRHNAGYVAWDLHSMLHWTGMSHDDFVNVFTPAQSLPYILLCFSTVLKLDVLFFIGTKQTMMSDAEEHKQKEQYERDLAERKRWFASQRAGSAATKPPLNVAKGEVLSPYSVSAEHEAKVGHKTLRVTGMYQWVRHPMYFWLQAVCVVTPYMTLDRFFYFLFTTALLSVGLKFEEQKLIREFGDQYRDYCKRTPMLFPITCGRSRIPTPSIRGNNINDISVIETKGE